MLKAIAAGLLLTGCVALVIGAQGASGGMLAVAPMAIGSVSIYWSWPLFLIGTGLSYGFVLLMR